VFNILLQILDDGRLTDGLGRTVDFKNTVFIMTSNVGSEHADEGHPDPEAVRVKSVEALYSEFRPEFLNRVDEVLVFQLLNRDVIGQIVEIQLREVAKRLAEQKMSIELPPPAKQLLVQEGFDPAYGARPLRRAIQRRILNPLAARVLMGPLGPGDSGFVAARAGEFVIAPRAPVPVESNGATRSRRRKAAETAG